MKVICFLFGHKWSSWKYVKPIGRWDELLKRTCKRCDDVDFYKGLTETTINGEKKPFRK